METLVMKMRSIRCALCTKVTEPAPQKKKKKKMQTTKANLQADSIKPVYSPWSFIYMAVPRA